MIFVGLRNCSSSKVPGQVAKHTGARDVHLVRFRRRDRPEVAELRQRAGVTSGPSMPDVPVEQVRYWLARSTVGTRAARAPMGRKPGSVTPAAGLRPQPCFRNGDSERIMTGYLLRHPSCSRIFPHRPAHQNS